tara:strand:- start:419 stop:841 length:423 start_codon:yes stop_codon:yes gene_type:complete
MQNYILVQELLSRLNFRGKTYSPNEYPQQTYLNKADFKEKCSQKDQFVWFFANYCGYCKVVQKDWAELRNTFDNDKCEIGSFDCNDDDNRKIAADFKIKGFPTFILFKKDGRKMEFPNGLDEESRSRTSVNFKKFINKYS